MIALDTNILVRLLTRDNQTQAETARLFFQRHADEEGGLFVSDVVMAELAWTLDRAYGFEHNVIAEAFKALADNATLSFESREVLQAALALFHDTKTGFPDCLIVAKAQAAGCKSLATFDKAMRSLPDVHLL